MIMLTGYKSKEQDIVIETSVSSENMVTVPTYKNKNTPLSGAKYLPYTARCMKEAFQSSLNQYKDTDNLIDKLAQQGLVVAGGKPDISLKPGEHIITLDNNGKLTIDANIYNFGNSIPYCKIWVSACAGGGGGANSQGEGGAGSGYAFFPMFLLANSSIFISIGSGGAGGEYTESSLTESLRTGTDGEDTIFCDGLTFNTSKIFAYIERGHGGHDSNRTVGQDRAEAGRACVYEGTISNVKRHGATSNITNSINLIIPDALKEVFPYTTDSFTCSVDKTSSGITNNSNTCSFVSTGGHGGDGNEDVSADGEGISVSNWNRFIDYSQAYLKNEWISRGGSKGYTGGDPTDWDSSGGGACFIFGSYGGNGGDRGNLGTPNRDGRNGAVGGGGGSGSKNRGAITIYCYKGGNGGDGRVDLWYKPSGSTIADDYPSGKDVSDEITINILSGDQSFQVTSTTIPSDKKINIDIEFIVYNMEKETLTGSSRSHGGPFSELTNKSLGFTYTMTDADNSYWGYKSVNYVKATIV